MPDRHHPIHKQFGRSPHDHSCPIVSPLSFRACLSDISLPAQRGFVFPYLKKRRRTANHRSPPKRSAVAVSLERGRVRNTERLAGCLPIPHPMRTYSTSAQQASIDSSRWAVIAAIENYRCLFRDPSHFEAVSGGPVGIGHGDRGLGHSLRLCDPGQHSNAVYRHGNRRGCGQGDAVARAAHLLARFPEGAETSMMSMLDDCI